MKYQKRQSKVTPGDYSLTILTRARAKEGLYIDSAVTDQDNVIDDLINAAVQFIEAGLDYSIDTSGLIYQYYDAFPSDGELPIWHRYITATDLVVNYWDGDSWEVFSSTNYRIDTTSAPPRVFLKANASWPTLTDPDSFNMVRIGFKMDTTHSFLDDVKAAVMAFVAARFENRESGEIPAGVMAVIDRHKLYS